jgi:hypothetical protein
MAITIEREYDMYNNGSTLTIKVNYENFMMQNATIIATEAIRLAAKQIAEDLIKEHYQEIIAGINPVAISNMAIAEAGAAVNETLHKKLPDKILEIERNHTEIYQKGAFGGLKRIR